MSRKISTYFCLSLLFLGLTSAQITVTVDPESGDDDACLSVRELAEGGPPYPSSPQPCQTLNRALDDNATDHYNTGNCSAVPSRFSHVRVLLRNGQHTLTSQLELVGATNVTVEAENTGQATIQCVEFPNYNAGNFDNFFACAVTGLRFVGVVFEKCGPVPSNVFVYNCSDVEFESCTFRGNTGASLQLRFVTSLFIENTTFIRNINNATPTVDQNETSIEDLYNIIQTSGGLTFFAGAHDIDVLIRNCSFIDNQASRNSPNDSRPVLLKQNGHGGAMLVRLRGTLGGSFVIEGTRFTNNYAQVDGGAIYVAYSDNAENNTITITNCDFIGNSVTDGAGGAVSVSSFNFTFTNVVTVEGCHFEGNSGSAGGAVSMALYDRNLESTEKPDGVLFNDCAFIGNSAINEGTAVGLFSLVHVDQVGFLVNFTNCHFENNTSDQGGDMPADKSAVAAFRFPTRFNGTNVFINNTGGGIMLLNTRLQALGILRFESNRAVFGGGIMMDDRCLLEVSPGLEMTFLNNHANESGGAIYVEFPPIRFVIDIFNRLCFLQYNSGNGNDVPPHEWENVGINFINNTARLSGAAIYASDMQRCTWLGNEYSYIENPNIFKLPPNLTSPFHYEGNRLEIQTGGVVRDVELATAPLQLHPSVEHTTVQPGEVVTITLSATDQLNNTREAVWALQAPNQDTTLDALSANNDTFLYTVPSLSSVPDGILSLNFSLLKTLGLNSSLSLEVQPNCHPGYTDYGDNTSSCYCDNVGNSDIIRCDPLNRYVYLREGVWGGVSDDGSLITTRVLPGYVRCDRQGRLPGCHYRFDEQNEQCQRGREGDLCGQCVEDTGVTMDLQTCSSVSCYYGLAAFLLFSCLLVAVLCFIVLWYDIIIPNELRGFVFYAQVIGLVYRPFSVANTRSGAIDPTAVIVNLLGFSVPIPLCLSQSLGAEHVALLGYIPPFIMLTTTLGFIIGARFIKPLAHHSAIKGITCLLFFFYKYIADTSFLFLSCVQTPLGFVFQYDGSVKCFSPYFGFFFVLALLIVVFIVAPLPFGLSYISYFGGPQYLRAFTDAISQGIKPERRLWGGWDVGRRLIFVIISFFVVIARPSLVLFIMALAALIVLIVHILSKPYEREYINIIEALILLDLVMVIGAFLDPTSNSVPITVGYILMFIPYVYCAGFFTFRISYYIYKRTKNKMVSFDLPVPSDGSDGSDDKKEEETAAATVTTSNDLKTPESGSSRSSTDESSDRNHETSNKTQVTLVSSSTDENSPKNTLSTSAAAHTTSSSTVASTFRRSPVEDSETTVALREPLLDDLF